MLLLASDIRMGALDHPPASDIDLQHLVGVVQQGRGLFTGRLRLVVNPELHFWQSIESWDRFDKREIAVLCIDERESPDRFTIYHGITFHDVYVIQTIAPSWIDRAVPVGD